MCTFELSKTYVSYYIIRALRYKSKNIPMDVYDVHPSKHTIHVLGMRKTELITVQNKLNNIQRLICLSKTAAMHTTSTAVIEIMLDPPSTHHTSEAEKVLCLDE